MLKNNVPQCVTLERPWLDNQPMVSCIPAGTYQVGPNNPEKPWRLQDVPSRTQVDIHKGNTIQDSEGCILVGTSFFPGGILESSVAMDFLLKSLPQNFTLTIINP
jgi:hypothetical protein